MVWYIVYRKRETKTERQTASSQANVEGSEAAELQYVDRVVSRTSSVVFSSSAQVEGQRQR